MLVANLYAYTNHKVNIKLYIIIGKKELLISPIINSFSDIFDEFMNKLVLRSIK
jgi:hypothetical protein